MLSHLQWLNLTIQLFQCGSLTVHSKHTCCHTYKCSKDRRRLSAAHHDRVQPEY